MEKILAISGKAESGKDTLAEYIKQKYEAQGKKVVIMHFAKYIKQMLRDYYGWNGNKDEYFRTKLQQLGTDRIRKQLNKPTFHCGRIAEDIEIIYDDFDIVLIPDTRFRNEVLYLKAMFPDITTAIRVVRLNHKSKLSQEQQNHPSETDLDNFNFDYTIYCQSGAQHLYDEADRVLKNIL